MGNKIIITIGVVVLLLIIIVFAIGYSLRYQKEISVLTDKTEYERGGTLKVKIKNNLGKTICFSSCYPYYFEKKNGEWEAYNYPECQTTDLIEKCIKLREIKAFEFAVPILQQGTHRLAIPLCINCKTSDVFRRDQWVYSNEFTLK